MSSKDFGQFISTYYAPIFFHEPVYKRIKNTNIYNNCCSTSNKKNSKKNPRKASFWDFSFYQTKELMKNRLVQYVNVNYGT